MKEYTVVTGNGSTYKHVAESIENHGNFFHFIIDGKNVGIQATYGVVSITDRPYSRRSLF